MFNLKKHGSPGSAAAEVMAINHIKASQTRTDKGIDAALQMCMDCERPGVPCVAVVLTDGESTDAAATKTQAEAAQQKITVIAVGVENADMAELQIIASGDGNANTFMVDNTADLKVLVTDITLAACEEGMAYKKQCKGRRMSPLRRQN